MKHLWVLILLVGCSEPEPQPPAGPSPVDRDLQQVRDTLAVARTLRVRLRGEWPHAVAGMPQNVTGTLLLGEGNRAKISLVLSYSPGRTTTYEAVCDGTKVWRSPNVEAAKFDPAVGAIRRDLLLALAWYGVGWSFPQGPHPKTIGLGYVVCDLVPQKRDLSPSRRETSDATLSIINHECPPIDYRVRLSFDPATHLLRKRELIGEKGAVWYVETYLAVEPNAAISDEEFRLPEK